MSGTNTAALGVRSRFGINTNAAATTVSNQLVVIRENLAKHESIVERAGIRGTRTHTSADTRAAEYSVAGTVELEPTPQDLALLLPLILGNAAVGNNYALAESLPYFFAAADRVTSAFGYTNLKVNRATFSGSKGNDPLIKLTLELAGQDQITNSNAATLFGSTSLTYYPPYIFTDLLLSLNAVARQADSFSLVIDNHLVTDRFMNQQMVVDLPEQDRTITLETNHGYTSNNQDLYEQALAGAAGYLLLSQAGTNYATNFQFSTLQVPAESPVVPGKEEIMLPLRMTARAAGSNAAANSELVVVHSSTP